ncbi:hypothetical protein [Pseudoprimorskyibacter insulae]|uniref:Uncharacterized protein n=1 Tax=Pseudoprimorskyibacter insulae TaxID=1695997 RepID=A0A2R8AQK0_9RHOB|nr:hypothetical protein [Pseudoprimorskyibacter insulae]SPF78351.1 hypothetical protein PRI8871_00948 [Pseudoprimorskyibacter insulae]
MPKGTKVATCTYCGTRAALVLRGHDRHELTCASCGAPLHDLKMLRTDKPAKHEEPSVVHGVIKEKKVKPSKGKTKKRKSFASRFWDEAFDAIEDIFD